MVVPPNKKLEVQRQTVFEYVVLKHPTIEEAEAGQGSEIIVPITQITANDEKDAVMLANHSIPQEQMQFRSRLEVAVRSF